MHAPDLLMLLVTWLQRLWEAVLPLGRLVLGWTCIIVGAVMAVSPVPFGFVVVIGGVALLGARNRALRQVRVSWKLLLRRWATSPRPALRSVGRRLRRLQRSTERQLRAWSLPQQTPEHRPRPW
jgi:hypothetical protein